MEMPLAVYLQHNKGERLDRPVYILEAIVLISIQGT
jgi:hypothetical protein